MGLLVSAEIVFLCFYLPHAIHGNRSSPISAFLTSGMGARFAEVVDAREFREQVWGAFLVSRAS
jgi:hypothetical protein